MNEAGGAARAGEHGYFDRSGSLKVLNEYMEFNPGTAEGVIPDIDSLINTIEKLQVVTELSEADADTINITLDMLRKLNEKPSIVPEDAETIQFAVRQAIGVFGGK